MFGEVGASHAVCGSHDRVVGVGLKRVGASTGELSPLGPQAHISHTQPLTLFL